MSDVTVSIEIDASPGRVWEVVEPIESHVDWMADAVAIRFQGEQTRDVGTLFDCDTKVGPIRLTDRMEITRWEPATDEPPSNGAMGVTHRGVVTGHGVFSIEHTSRGTTRFTWSEDLVFPWWLGGRLGQKVAGRFVLGPIWRRNLAALKSRVEAG
jgi:hypothetical protein